MSETWQGPGWWLASDGKWYPPDLAPGAVPQQQPPPPQSNAPLPGPSVPRSLTQAAQIAMGFVAGLHVLLLIAFVQARSTLDDAWNSSFTRGAWDDAVAAEDRLISIGAIILLCQVGALVLFIVWMWRSHKAGDRLRPGDRKWSKGWTIGAWLIPIANVVLPRKVMTDIERVARSPRDGGRVTQDWRSFPTLPIGQIWWILIVIGTLLGRTASGMNTNAIEDFDTDGVLEAYVTGAIGAGVTTVAFLCAIPLIGSIGARLTDEAFAETDASTATTS